MINKKTYLFILAALFPVSLVAQKGLTTPKLEDLPCYPMDTLDTVDPDVKVVIYTNNTWSFHYPEKSRLTAGDVFRQHWDTTQVFAYKTIELKDLPQSVEIDLVNDISGFHSPIVGRVFSKYGPRGRRNHNGVDVPLKTGEPIYATFCGKVRYARYNSGGFGNLVIIRHGNGLETWYAHLSRCNVRVNDYVKAGAVIGFGGSTGRSRGPHLHFEMRYCDQTFDPERLIDFETGDLRYITFELEKTYFSIYSRSSDKLEEDDFEGSVLGAGEDLTSEDILKNIEAHEQAQLAKPKPTDPLYHTIRNGDTLSKIARQYGTTVSNLCKLNNITSTTTIRAGKRLRVR